ncbi:flagellar hook-length control protein FliK [Paenibacillus woosongensis]|uniref:Flagellar hook-length control protein FliK n=1 Tax=Paenibacillus woosongensis TaxID=307580 RepID=A0AA95I5R1_9BACL|nr:flagellar hook-length control protein FliK [Paenibacillus woosongensis]WHX51074.1 flagellar hook-length control protein FliK [Paenibacillus woosongensis]
MNIGPLMRSLMGDSRPGEPRALELKTGQIVRGTVLSVSEDGQEAVIQVQGVKLHAALETPLRQGETTLLQVQQPSADGLAVLKPVGSNTAAPMSAASLANALAAMGLEDTAANRELVQMMRASGLPLTKESLHTLQQLTLHKPQAVPMSEWIQAAGIALGRGLPLTGETVAGLHQAVFGPPLHELLTTLEELLSNLVRSAEGNGAKEAAGNRAVPAQAQGQAWAGQPSAQTGNAVSGQAHDGNASSFSAHAAAATAGSPSGGLPAGQAAQGGQAAMPNAGSSAEALVGKLQQVLQELRAAISPPGGAAAAERGAASSAPQQSPAAAAGTAAAMPAAAAAPAAQAQAQGEVPAGPSPALLTRPAPEAEPWVGRVLKLLGAEHEQQVLRAAPSSAQEAPPAAGAAQRAAAGGAEAPGGSGQAGSAPAAAPDHAPAAALRGEAASGTLQAASTGAAAGGAGQAAPGAQAHGAAVAQQAGVLPEAAARETLKGVLLQLLAADDVPAPLQEAARQLVHQLTGQQLLLNTDRTAPFAQVTLFLPFIGEDGEQTAAVHIESRRGRKGELDAANCRLWFDLQMKSLGLIMLDVQVLDKKVMLKIYAEAETTGQFLESREEEVQEALQTAGYQLVSLKSGLLPSVEPETMGANEPGSPFSYTPTTYKGVDYRI